MKELQQKTKIGLSTLSAHKAKERTNSYLYEFIEIPDETEFAFYRGDDFIDIGTRKELMEKYNLTPNTFAFYISPTAKKRAENKKRLDSGMVIERIEDDE